MDDVPSLWSMITNVWNAAVLGSSRVWGDCRDRIRPLLVAGLAWRLGSALLLPTFYAFLLRLVILGSGQTVLTDLDLFYFLTTPIGVIGLAAMGVAITAVLALEASTVLVILSQPADTTSFTKALIYTWRRAPRLIGVALRVVTETILWLAPAVAMAAGTYIWLLCKYDINYYLSERPPSFWLSGFIAFVLLIYVLFVALKQITDWFLALPVVLFEDDKLSGIAAICKERIANDRWSVRAWISGWFIGTTLVSSAITFVVGIIIWLVSPCLEPSLIVVAVGIGLALTMLVLLSMLINLVSVIFLVALIRRFYLQLGGIYFNQEGSEQYEFESYFWITPAHIVVCLVLSTLGLSLLGLTAINGVTIEDKAILIGHRGSPKSAPGNTLASVRAAINDGADWVEIDVQETADGEVYVFHDSDLMKAAGINLKIWDATAEQLSSIDIGSNFSSEFAGEPIPTFAAVLLECRGKVGVVVELKDYGHSIALEERVVEIVERLDMVDKTMFMSLDRSAVARIRALRPKWKVGQLFSFAIGTKSEIQADFLAVNASFANRELIRSSHRAGREIYAWTVNDPLAISSLISRGIDGIITDEPEVARSVLAERANMYPVTRLLVDLADRFQFVTLFQAKLARGKTTN